MKLYAISDLHLSYKENRQALQQLCPHPHDWLIIAGDLGEIEEHYHFAFSTLQRCFARLIWTPGNHDLWTLPMDTTSLRGEDKYRRLVEICRSYGVVTPEDPYVIWENGKQQYCLAPVFTLYDYSFCPDDIDREQAIPWAVASGVLCKDESVLHSTPYPSKSDWCNARCRYTEHRLQQISSSLPLVLISHFPTFRDLAKLPRIPRFSLWCGTRRTEDWHRRFPIKIVVYGHLHIRGTYYRDGVRFEEVSLGYPKQWNQERSLRHYLREILPVSPSE